ncbi:hypothetical protein AAG596_14675 [Citromicrobium bathyomarinum]|uniref:hypothetical protein n=1 Tax=Citromicrobium bathyomarinum TaxID=72174 RepID=UPI00315AC762
MGVRSKYRWVVSSGAILALSTFAYDWAVQEWFENPNAVVEWAQSIFGEQGFYWLVFALCGLALGAWLDLAFERFDREKYAHLVEDIIAYNNEIIKGLPYTDDRSMILLSQAAAIERQLERHGIPPFDCALGTNKATTAHKCAMMYQQILPSLKQGDRRGACRIMEEYNRLENESVGNAGKYETKGAAS